MYGQNTKCKVHFKKSSTCPSLVVSCPKFDLAHNKAHCKGRKGDFVSLGKKRFCQKKGPNKFRSSGNKLTVSFTSDRTVEGEGAECTIACSDLVPTAHVESWNAWGEWSQCSTTCDQGSRLRIRSCSGGSSDHCPGDPAEAETCKTADCQVAVLSWNGWGEWNQCSTSCGQGSRLRMRACSDSTCGGSSNNCPGDATESEACKTT